MHNFPEFALFDQPENGQGTLAACCCFRKGVTCVSADGNLQKCWASKAAPWHLWLNHTGTPSPDAAVMVANVKSQHSHHVNQNVMLKHRSFSSKTNKFMGIAKFF